MGFSQIITAALINLLAQVLPAIGLDFGNDQLATLAQVLVALGTTVWIWVQRTKLRKVEAGETSDITLAGVKK